MLRVELGPSAFTETGMVYLGSLPEQIARATPGAKEEGLPALARKYWPAVNGGVQTGALTPLHPLSLVPVPAEDIGNAVVPFTELQSWGRSTGRFEFVADADTRLHEEPNRAARERVAQYYLYETWPPHWAALLVCGLEPPAPGDDFSFGRIPNGAKMFEGTFVLRHQPRMREAQRILTLWESQPEPAQKIRPADFVVWCRSKGINTAWLEEVAAPATGAGGSIHHDERSPAKPVSRFEAQEAAILNAIRSEGHDPKALPKSKPGTKGLKSKIRDSLKGDPRFVGTVFDKAWERLRAQELIADKV